MIMKYLFIIILLFLFSCDSNYKKHKEEFPLSDEIEYPLNIDNDGVPDILDLEYHPRSIILYETSNYGDINYVVNDTMVVGEISIVNMTISKSVNKEILINDINTFNENNLFTEVIRISPIMSARLIDPKNGENFIIVSITPEEQLIESDDYTKWQWQVTPLNKGNHKLTLTVDIIYETNRKNIKVYDDFIYVYNKDKLTIKLLNFFKNNWEWLLSTLLIPFFIFIYNKKYSK